MNLPNKLTSFRVIIVPFYILCFFKEWYIVSIILFVIASITDAFDGKLARKRNTITNFGKIMDPLADKILVYTAFVLLTPNIIKKWMIIVILIREFLISGIRTVAASNGNVISAGFSGKLKTCIQMISVPFTLLSLKFPEIKLIYILSQILIYLSVLLTIYSGFEYTINNKEVFKN